MFGYGNELRWFIDIRRYEAGFDRSRVFRKLDSVVDRSLRGSV
jgi:hypothetical protein